jgi:hypothetical protein
MGITGVRSSESTEPVSQYPELQQPFIKLTKMDPGGKLPANHINPHLVYQNFEIL